MSLAFPDLPTGGLQRPGGVATGTVYHLSWLTERPDPIPVISGVINDFLEIASNAR
jgi:hypothetical protein